MSRATSVVPVLALCAVLIPDAARADDRPGDSVASVTSRVQGLPLAEWREELDLTADQVRALEEVDAWFVAERDALVARGRGQGGHGLAQRYRGLRGELERRLGAALTPAQLDLVDVRALLPLDAPPVSVTIISSGLGTSRVGFDEGRGRVATAGATANAQVRLNLARPFSVTIGAGGGITAYDFDRAEALDPLEGDPFETLYSARLSLGATWQLSAGWTAFANVNASSSVEEGVALEDGLVFGGFAGASYAFSENFSLGLGVSFNTQLEDDARVIPLPIVRLRVDLTDTVRFSLGMPEGIRLTWAPLPELELALTGGLGNALSARDARLDDDGFASGGVIRQTAYPVGVVLDWRPHALLSVSVDAGVLVYRKLEIDDERGHSLTEVKTDPAGFLSIGVNLAF